MMFTAPNTDISSKRLLLDLDGTILEITNEALKILRGEPSDIIGRRLSDLVREPDAEGLIALLNQAMTGAPTRCPLTLAGADGVEEKGELYLVPAGTAIEAIWATASDDDQAGVADLLVTRTPVFEKLFHAYLQLQEANKRKTAMIAAATHEVKTPLAIMNGACDLLLSGKSGTLNDLQVEMVKLFSQNCQRLLNVMQTILSYSAAEHGKMRLRMEREDVAALVLEIIEQWKPLTQSRGIKLTHRIASNLPPVLCDRSKLQTVLNGLCDNAMKFTPTGGKISLTAEPHFWDRRFALAMINEERRRKAESRINSVRLSVADNGAGIAPEYHQEIFEEYFQAPGGRSGGMGLGLAIAREIMAGHKGKIWVESEPRHGSTFHLVLPL